MLVWVNPIQDGRDRLGLNALLRGLASTGTWISAHPDVIDKLGVKDVLFRTRDMGWGADTELYSSLSDFGQRFLEHLSPHSSRVLKRSRGNDGQASGKWSTSRPLGSKPWCAFARPKLVVRQSPSRFPVHGVMRAVFRGWWCTG